MHIICHLALSNLQPNMLDSSIYIPFWSFSIFSILLIFQKIFQKNFQKNNKYQSG